MNRISLLIKRIIDIILCVIVSIITLPLFLIIPILIKLTYPGPVFFIQKRVGINGRPFNILKFRTMHLKTKNIESKEWSEEEEARITSIGRILRDFGLDELPQLFNIFKGDMSIIGPRAMLEHTVETIPDKYKTIFEMRPGVLSLAAIEGRRSIPMDKRIELHAKYVKEWSLLLDVKILWKSLFIVILRKNARDVIPETEDMN